MLILITVIVAPDKTICSVFSSITLYDCGLYIYIYMYELFKVLVLAGAKTIFNPSTFNGLLNQFFTNK